MRSPNEAPYVISYRLLIHMEAVRVIFGQIQGDHINFTMAAVAAMLVFFSRVREKKSDFYMSQRLVGWLDMLAKFGVD